tara:strand:- start:22129 stop:22473 length:345 start_codon:yes stop_codon:yes gene_type:complete
MPEKIVYGIRWLQQILPVPQPTEKRPTPALWRQPVTATYARFEDREQTIELCRLTNRKHTSLFQYPVKFRLTWTEKEGKTVEHIEELEELKEAVEAPSWYLRASGDPSVAVEQP